MNIIGTAEYNCIGISSDIAVRFSGFLEVFIMGESTEKGFGVCAYLGFLFLVPLLAGKTQFSRYHANQGIVLFIADVILGTIIGLVTLLIGFIPVIGPIIAGVVGGVLGLVIFIFMIIGIVHAANGEMKPLPIIGGITIIK